MATTATPLGTWTTCSTPGTARAALGSKPFRVAPNTGARETNAVRSPGKWTSIPNPALPVIFSGVSRRRWGLPTCVHRSGGFKLTLFGEGSALARSANVPNEARFFPLIRMPSSTRI